MLCLLQIARDTRPVPMWLLVPLCSCRVLALFVPPFVCERDILNFIKLAAECQIFLIRLQEALSTENTALQDIFDVRAGMVLSF